MKKALCHKNISVPIYGTNVKVHREQSRREVVIAMNPCLFTKIVAKNLTKLPVMEVLPYINFIAFDNGLKTSHENEFKTAKHLLINAIENN